MLKRHMLKLINQSLKRLQDESYLAFLDMLVLDLVKTKRVNRVPMLVLGAEHDGIVSHREIRRTAAVYDAEAILEVLAAGKRALKSASCD